ncbi:hypothetical protein LOD99_15686 [Oopsacas minuta]|uniref:Uncharacterized protein n=1 Tax=Oopsacas minuta TaxID=111878 RepID=A0AAV7KBH2_9METZ|nr:hypothetical protein LOD99_15686 [Oopsacas minuta]
MIEIFLITIAAFSTLTFLTFLCVRNKYDVQTPMRKSNSFQIEGAENGMKIQPRNKNSPKNQPKFNDNDPCFKDKSSDIEKGLVNSNATNSCSTQRAESDKDSDSSLFSPNLNATIQSNSHPQESVVFANPRTTKHSHREMALPLPPHLQHIESNSDQFLQRSYSDAEKSILAQVKASNSSGPHPEHPLEISTSKRSLIPLPSTPNDVITQRQPPPVLKRGKSHNELDTVPGNVDLGYEALTMDRNVLNKRNSSDVMKESYPRPKHYAQLKKNSYHGSLSDVTPPNSARVQRSFDFSPKNTKRRRAVSNGPESSPFHPPIISTTVSQNNTDKRVIESTKPNQYASELKPILSVIINDMNRRTLEDSLSPVDEFDSSPTHRHDSSDTSEIHENSIYNLNELSTLSSPEVSSSSQSKKRDTSESNSSSDDYSIHENNLYESIEGELDRNAPHSVMSGQGSLSEQNNSVFYSELERKESDNQPNRQHSTYYDSITLMRIEDSDESNGSTKANEESNYGKFVKNSIKGLEDYDTLTHFPSTSPKCNNQYRSSPESLSPSKNDMNTPPDEDMKQHQYDYLSKRAEDDIFRSNIIARTRKSIHDYEKINEDDLVNLKQFPGRGEIGPF